LEERLTQVAELLDLPSISPEVDVLLAALTLDRAVGLASDCQRSKEATVILRQHLGAHSEQAALSVPAAIAMLGPATDHARLLAMSGRMDEALSWLTRLRHAVRTGSGTSVGRHILPLDRVDGAPEELQLLRDWAWSRLLADAVKVLAVAGRWSEASDLVTRQGGPAARLTETRQVLVVAHLVDGEREAARHHLVEAATAQLWEVEVASCLSVLAAEPADRGDVAAVMLGTFRRSRPEPLHAGYRARYGVTVARLAHATGHPYADIARQLAAEAITLRDGHAAREVLRNVGGFLSRKDVAALTRNVTRAGLTGDHLTGYNLTRLRTTADRAAANLRNALHQSPR
jgi:hypothetical protein